ncbi:MAG: Uma2 family endonuclease [Cyclobacteriaceae bacterium]
METVIKQRTINVEEYYKMAEAGIIGPEEKVELINGKIFEMSPIGARHAFVVKNLLRVLSKLSAEEFTLGIQDPIRLDNNSEPEPDVSVAKGDISKYQNNHPTSKDLLLIVEVAESTLNFDRDVKIPLYASSGIKEYWIVNIPENQIEVYQSPQGNNYSSKSIYTQGDKITLLESEFTVSVRDILGNK